MDTLQHDRKTLGVSQSKLARLSGVSRFKICTSELGSTNLSPEDQQRIRMALEREASRLLAIAARITLDKIDPEGA